MTPLGAAACRLPGTPVFSPCVLAPTQGLYGSKGPRRCRVTKIRCSTSAGESLPSRGRWPKPPSVNSWRPSTTQNSRPATEPITLAVCASCAFRSSAWRRAPRASIRCWTSPCMSTRCGCCGPACRRTGPPCSSTDYQPRLLNHRGVLEAPVAGGARARPLGLHELRRHDLAGDELRRTLARDIHLERHRGGVRIKAGRIATKDRQIALERVRHAVHVTGLLVQPPVHFGEAPRLRRRRRQRHVLARPLGVQHQHLPHVRVADG